MADAQKKAIGRRIKELREAKRWTQHELAGQIPDPKVDSQSVSKWERGVYQPRKHLEALAKALGVTEGSILAGDKADQGDTPDLLGQLNGSQLDRIESMLKEVLGLLHPEATSADQAHEEQVEREIAAGVPDQQEPSEEAPPGRAAGDSRRASG